MNVHATTHFPRDFPIIKNTQSHLLFPALVTATCCTWPSKLQLVILLHVRLGTSSNRIRLVCFPNSVIFGWLQQAVLQVKMEGRVPSTPPPRAMLGDHESRHLHGQCGTRGEVILLRIKGKTWVDPFIYFSLTARFTICPHLHYRKFCCRKRKNMNST